MSLITCKNRRGGTLSFLLAVLFAVATSAALPALADVVVDLNGETISADKTAFSTYKDKILQNGTINLSNSPSDSTAGKYTIGSGATVNYAAGPGFNGNWDLNIVDGGVMRQTLTSNGRTLLPFHYGNCKFTLDNGTFITDDGSTSTGAVALNFAMFWNNNSAAKGVDASVAVVIRNGSTLSIPNGKLRISGGRENESQAKNPAKTAKVDFAVTNSTITVKDQIYIGSNISSSKWVTDAGNSYVHVVFGPGADITCNNIYAYKSIVSDSEVLFDGATVRKSGSDGNFIGQNTGLSGDIYTIGEGGLTIDIPSDQSFTAGSNMSVLKGTGGLTKIGAGSITVNSIVSSSSAKTMTFTGPLTVTEGTWSSSLGYASKVFNVSGEGSVLELSGALSADEINFNVSEGGLLKLTGATTPNDTAPDMSISAGGVLEDVSTEPRTFSALALGEGCAVKVAGSADGVVGILADELALSATEENQVALKFSSATEIPVGTYAVITINGEGAFTEGDDRKFSLEETVPENSQLTLSEDKKSLLLIVPATNPATWIGNAGDGKFSTAGNWLGGKVPGADDEIDIKAATDIELECDIPIAVKAISIHPESAKVTINGAGSITLSEKIVNASEKMMTVNVPVEFKTAEGEDAAIDVTGEVDFQGGVKGTYPVNHTTFYGTYTLTAQSWTLSKAITMAEGAKINAEGMKLSLNGNKLLRAYKNSEFKLSSLEHKNAGELFGDYFGLLKVSTIDLMNNSGNVVTLNKAFTGILYVDIVKSFVRSNRHKWEVEGETVIGNGGFRSAGGGYYLGAAGSRLVLRSSGDWSFSNDFNNTPHNGYYNYGYTIQASNLDIDTSDFDGNDEGHTVVVELGNTKGSQPEKTLLGDSCVSAFGNGMFKFNNICYFTGGFTASNDVTVVVKKGVYPGKGNVTIKDTATLKLVDSDSGTVPVAGKLTMEGGSTLHIPQFSASVVPISVNSFEFANVENNKKVTLKIDGGSLINGYNVILESDNAIPENAWSMIELSADGVSIPEGMEASYVTQGNALCILVKGANDCIWTGSGDASTFNNEANWRDGKIPSNGANLYIPASSDITIINDIENFAPASITFSAGSGSVTIDGEEAINVTSITNLSSASHTINVPVYFTGDIAVAQNARGYATRNESHITFAGGAYAAEGCTIAPWRDGYSYAVFGRYVLANTEESPYAITEYKVSSSDDIRFYVAPGSALEVPYAGAFTELDLAEGGVVTNRVVSMPEGQRLSHRNYGEYVIADEFTVSGSGRKDGYAGYKAGTGAANVFKIEKATCTKTDGCTFYFAEGNGASCGTYYFGKGGINFGDGKGYFGIGKNSDGDAQTIRPWYSDFIIGTGAGNTDGLDMWMFRSITFNTDDENGVGRKITLNARPRFNHTPSFTVAGSGTVLVNSVASNNAQPPVTVTDTATLAFKPGALLTTDTTTVASGATLSVAESGTVALGGDLMIADGAKLKFTFTQRNVTPVLDVTGKNVTFGESKSIIVAVEGDKRPTAGRHILTSGGQFSGATVNKAETSPKWVLGIGVNDDGNIYADIKPIGTRIIVR